MKFTRELIAALFLMLPAFAAPMNLGHVNSDANFDAFLTARGVDKDADLRFVGQGRIGNNAINGDYEVGLHTPPQFTNAGPVAADAGKTNQFVWGAAGFGNTAKAFTLSRVADTVTFVLGNYSASWMGLDVSDANLLAIRTASRTPSGNTGDNTITLDNLMYNGNALAGSSSASNGARDYVVFSGFDGDFTLTGNAKLNWNGTKPNGSNLAFQIKAYEDASAVPEPGTYALLGTGLVGLFFARRKR